MTTEQKTVTIDARHTFTDAEMSQLGIHASRSHRDFERTEEEFKSAKKDWQGKLDRIALDRDGVLRKLGDGFEMRPTLATVSFNDPSPGRKTYRCVASRFDGDTLILQIPAIIREEAMDATDFQRDLPLEEAPKIPPGESMSDQEERERAEREPVDPERLPETGDSAAEVKEARQIIRNAAEPIGTSLADKLALAAQGAAPNPVVIDFAGKDDGNKCLAKWRKAARFQGWPEACVDLIDGLAKDALAGTDTAGTRGSKQRVLDVLGSHSISEAEEYARVNAASCAENEKLAATFGASEGDAQ